MVAHVDRVGFKQRKQPIVETFRRKQRLHEQNHLWQAGQPVISVSRGWTRRRHIKRSFRNSQRAVGTIAWSVGHWLPFRLLNDNPALGSSCYERMISSQQLMLCHYWSLWAIINRHEPSFNVINQASLSTIIKPSLLTLDNSWIIQHHHILTITNPSFLVPYQPHSFFKPSKTTKACRSCRPHRPPWMTLGGRSGWSTDAQ